MPILKENNNRDFRLKEVLGGNPPPGIWLAPPPQPPSHLMNGGRYNGYKPPEPTPLFFNKPNIFSSTSTPAIELQKIVFNSIASSAPPQPPPSKKACLDFSLLQPSKPIQAQNAQKYEIPQEFFIPVPKNAQTATTIFGRLRIARWALDKALKSNILPSSMTYEARQLVGISWYRAWSLGFLVYQGKRVDPKMGIEGLKSLEWDTNVNILDENIPDINDPSFIEDQGLTYGERCLASRVMQILISAHISAFQAGIEVVQAVMGNYGNTTLKKTIDQCGLKVSCNLDCDQGKQLVANMTGCVSPIAVMKWILIQAKRNYYLDLKEIHDVLDTNFGMVENVDLNSLDEEWNVDLKIPIFGGGAGRHEKALKVLRAIADTPLWSIFPHLKEIDAFLYEYTALSQHPLRYGNNAVRFCGTKSVLTNDLLNKLSPDLSVFVQLNNMTSLMKFFERKFKNQETRHWVEKMEEYIQAKKCGHEAVVRFERNIPANLKWNQALLQKARSSLFQRIKTDENFRAMTSYGDIF